MKKTLALLTAAILMAALVSTARADSPIGLFLDGTRQSTEIPPRIVEGRVLIPVRDAARILEADVSWDSESRAVNIHTPGWLRGFSDALDKGAEKISPVNLNESRMERTWRIDSGLYLFEHIRHHDVNYVLGNTASETAEIIVPFIENARFREITESGINFTARGGDDTGNFRFPYRLHYNFEDEKLTESSLYLDKDLSFGALYAWKHIFRDISVDDVITLSLYADSDQVLAGGHKTPLTVIHHEDTKITMRLHGITGSDISEGSLDSPTNLVDSVSWKIMERNMVTDMPVLEKEFPYGHELEENDLWDDNSQVLEITIRCSRPATINVSAETAGNDPEITYTISLKE